MSKKSVLPPLIGRNPLVHIAGIAQSLEQEYAECVNSSYSFDTSKVDRIHQWAAQACALFDMLEQIELNEEDLELYRGRIQQYTVELALRYKKAETDES